MKNSTQIPATAPLSIDLLGGFRMERGGVVLTDDINRSQKLWSVLAYLVIHRDRPVAQTELIETFWNGDKGVNPASALKTLLYRIRTMIEPLFGQEVEPVIAHRGAYAWNGDIPCYMDTDRFEQLCVQAQEKERGSEERLCLCREAAALYRGTLLPKLAGQQWLEPIAKHYHDLFVSVVRDLSDLLMERSLFDELAELCLRASDLDPLNQQLHTLAIRALLCQGHNAQALSHYETATELLYRKLRERPGEELRNLYTEIMREEQELELDLDVIRDELSETADRPGAFVCEYGFFREIYRLETRRAGRSGVRVHIALLTVSMPDGSAPPLKQLNTTMDQLLAVLQGHMRSGDVISRYSAAQYIIMLPSAGLEESDRVLERVISAFYRQHRYNFLKITCKVREVNNTAVRTPNLPESSH